ncbi:MAG: hypothetical protein M1834_003477 [Cirrosporium novae-zelandiae]|nr:MAG: hypothetical protein M1834_003477 [Cirrosporium novae-zelandiae]
MATPFLENPPSTYHTRSPSTDLSLPLHHLSNQTTGSRPNTDIELEPLVQDQANHENFEQYMHEEISESSHIHSRHHTLESNSLSQVSDQMRRAPRSSKAKNFGRPRSSLSEKSDTSTNGSMDSHIGLRRKHPSMELTSEAQTARLMSRDSFTLDEEPNTTPQTSDPSNHGFFDLPRQDRRNFLLLVMLYFLQGIPMGLAHGSVPFLLKSQLSYGQIGVFSLATYPYSLKLLWSPIVDAIWSPKVGRRKSWIMPIQVLSGFGMIYLGGRINGMISLVGDNGGAGVWPFTWWWFFLVFLCATQDIAVDGWALTLLSAPNLSYASTAQSVGLTAGSFLSYTVFLAFNSPDFANRWFRAVPSDEGVLTLGGYLTFWGWAYVFITFGLAILKKEERTKERDGIADVYKSMLGILKLKNFQTVVIVYLIAKIGFQANESATNLKLLDLGFSQEDMAMVVLIDFPFEIGLGYFAGKWSMSYAPMRLWCWSFVGRLLAAAFAQLVVIIFPKDGVTTWYVLVVIAEHIFSISTSTIMFVASSAFHARVADPVIGGTYMTMLATVSNLGGTFPKYFVLKLIDFFTVATCTPPTTSPSNLKTDPLTGPFSCVVESEKHRCLEGGGTCDISQDGYQITNAVCIIFGVITFYMYIRPAVLKLQSLPLRAWRLVG